MQDKPSHLLGFLAAAFFVSGFLPLVCGGFGGVFTVTTCPSSLAAGFAPFGALFYACDFGTIDHSTVETRLHRHR